MHNIKKLLSIFSLVLIAVAFIACSKDGESSEFGTWFVEQSKSLWYWMAIAAAFFANLTSSVTNKFIKVLNVLTSLTYIAFWIVVFWFFPHWWYVIVMSTICTGIGSFAKGVSMSAAPTAMDAVIAVLFMACTIVMYIAYF